MMIISYITTILKFKEQGEKTGWTYIEAPIDIALKLNPNNKKSFRVKGKLDNYPIQKIALLPMGEGNFILPLNEAIRKGIGKKQGAMLQVKLEKDKSEVVINSDLMDCLVDDADALAFFNQLAKSHQHYFSKWIEGAKTDVTKTKRIAQTVNALSQKIGYSEMIRSLKEKK